MEPLKRQHKKIISYLETIPAGTLSTRSEIKESTKLRWSTLVSALNDLVDLEIIYYTSDDTKFYYSIHKPEIEVLKDKFNGRKHD